MSINAAHDSSPDMIIPDDLDLYRMAFPYCAPISRLRRLYKTRKLIVRQLMLRRRTSSTEGDDAITAERDREPFFQPECVDR